MFDSCHPRYTGINIPYNLARRLCTTISGTEIMDTCLKDLQQLLLQRYYPKKLIRNGITKALDRKELQKSKTPNRKNVIPYVSTHNLQNSEFVNVIRNNLPILEEYPNMKKYQTTLKSSKVKNKALILKQLLQKHSFPVIPKKFLLSRDATNLDTVHVLISQKDPIFISRTGENLQFKRLYVLYKFKPNLCQHLCWLW